MKIVFIVHRFHPNLYFPIKALVKNGHEVEIIVPKTDEFEGLSEDYEFVKPISLAENELTPKFIFNYLKENKPDVIFHRHFIGKWILFSLISRLMGIKTITYNQYPHTSDNLLKILTRPLIRLIKGRPVKRFTPVLNTGYSKPYSDPFSVYIPFPIEVINNVHKKNASKTLSILCVGKLAQKRKRHLFLLDVLEKLDIDCSITFVGAGPKVSHADNDYYNDLEKRCQNSSLKGGAFILKNLSYKEMLRVYSEKDVLIMPAIEEAHGQCILEGLAAGLPVIATNDCGASCYIEDGFNGFVFDAYNEKELSEKISYLYNNPGVIREMGSNAIERIEEVHSLKKFSENIESIALN